jgi:predicted GNAT family acetyltransferase
MTVEHDTAGRRFVARLDGHEGELLYGEFGEGIVDLQHTEVPRALQGKGVADALVRAALAWAREQGYRVVATCPYVQRWLRKHPEERP